MDEDCSYLPLPSLDKQKQRSKAALDSVKTEAPSTPSSTTSGDCAPSTVADSRVSSGVLDRIVAAAEGSMDTGCTGMNMNTSLALEHPDLVATHDDWVIVAQFFNSSDRIVRASAAHRLISTAAFLDSFFAQPAPLRLTICALAAHANPSIPDNVCISYYNRARKAVMRSIDKPSLKNLQTLYLIANFAIVNGQPTIGKPFFINALWMLIHLRMDVDPDASPWLAHLNLSELEKEERRRAFWLCFYTTKLVQSCSTPSSPARLSAAQMRPPKSDIGSLFSEILTTQHNCSILELIISIKRHYAYAPASLNDLILSEQALSLSAELLSLHSEIPQFLLLAPEPTPTADHILMQNKIFISQLLSVGPTDTTGIISLSMFFNASICLLHRPKLYLTHFLPNASATAVPPSFIPIIASALKQCLTAAYRMSDINRFLLHITQDAANIDSASSDNSSEHPQLLPKSFWEAHNYLAHPLFECAIVLWFIACKTSHTWFDVGFSLEEFEWLKLRRSLSDGRVRICSKNIKACLRDILKSYAILNSALGGRDAGNETADPLRDNSIRPNMVTPMITCVQAMLKDVELAHFETASPENMKEASPDIESVLLGMKVMSLGEEDRGGSTEVVEDPWCFMGLMGLDVMGFRWRAPYEDSWRQFWNT
ncbi:hypothetical protein HDU78_009550 [Chytriomyces hyalinus]|nr:hypothetical protein HDU78_009550 [Chytriomyces hyalinus]